MKNKEKPYSKDYEEGYEHGYAQGFIDGAKQIKECLVKELDKRIVKGVEDE